tara:strand:- start:208 stop:480 length:273 start_codon:yes stop_codon:yes gene_type:complete
MKKVSFILLVAFAISVFPSTENVEAQIGDILVNVDTGSCTTGDCEVVTRQYTGLTTRYTIAIRCMDSGGNFGSWSRWAYQGINPGSYCNT